MFKNAEIYNEKTALLGLTAAATVFLPVAPFLRQVCIMGFGIIGKSTPNPISILSMQRNVSLGIMIIT